LPLEHIVTQGPHSIPTCALHLLTNKMPVAMKDGSM